MGAFAFLFLACIVMALATGLLSHPARAYADFGQLANRATRLVEPCCYNSSGTCTCDCVKFSQQFDDFGNVGIGNGDRNLMKPDVMSGMIHAAKEGLGPDAAVPIDDSPVTESLSPNNVLAASIIPEGYPLSITVNKPYPHILNENPVEAGVLYGKLYGLPMPGGYDVDMGIKCLGYEY